MSEGLLDHLTDDEFDRRMDQLDDELLNALNRVLDDWVKDGVIDENGKKIMLDDWDNKRLGLFHCVG